MAEIKCPKCGEVFQVDESGYAQILQQVRDEAFEKELKKRAEEMAEKKDSAFNREKSEMLHSHENAINKLENEKAAAVAELQQKIAELQGKVDNVETAKALAVNEAVTKKAEESETSLKEKESKINDLEKQVLELNGKLQTMDSEAKLREKSLTERHAAELKMKDEQIEQYKDFKLRQSTKMIGESLEQYCHSEFNKIRMTAFPNAYFEKDNDASSGSKGDFIYRDYADGTEYISIMFEMKNEADETKTKHKNEDFFKELDKDRNEKKCEYAVLVTMLEADNEYYNTGIVDVSYRYDKMYVIRPQFFIPLITMLRNAAYKSLDVRRELQVVRDQKMDLTNFEAELDAFKANFADSFRKAGDRFESAIDGIDKTINQLTKIREALVMSEKHLTTANNKLDSITIKKLTKNAPSVREELDRIRNEKEN